MSIEFKSIEELYKRVSPALGSKVKELKRLGIKYVKEEDIWNYLVETKWKTGRNLELFDIVDDILNTDNKEIDEYVKNQLQAIEREVKFEDIDLV